MRPPKWSRKKSRKAPTPPKEGVRYPRPRNQWKRDELLADWREELSLAGIPFTDKVTVWLIRVEGHYGVDIYPGTDKWKCIGAEGQRYINGDPKAFLEWWNSGRSVPANNELDGRQTLEKKSKKKETWRGGVDMPSRPDHKPSVPHTNIGDFGGEVVEGGVLLPLDRLHALARERGILRMPNQVFIPTELFSGGEVSRSAQRDDDIDPDTDTKIMDPVVLQDVADALSTPVPPAKATPLATFIKEAGIMSMGRPDAAPRAIITDVRERVRKQVGGSDDTAVLRQELEGITFSEDQERAYAGITTLTGSSTILTGEAGTGKSTVIKKVRADNAVALCATTGIAAMNIGACTIDSMFSYDRVTNAVRSTKRLGMVMEVVPKKIVIDEASMIGSKMAAYILQCARTYGKQLILCGDWAQAAPVKDGWATESDLVLESTVHKLTQVHRQSDPRYLAALNVIRRGEVSPLVHEVFTPQICHTPPDDDTYIRLFATNATTDAYNMSRLMSVPSQTKIWRLFAEYIDTRDDHLQEKYPVTIDAQNKALEASRMAHNAQFRIGARVMVRMNDPGDDRKFVNGDLGTIVDAWTSHGSHIEDAPPFNPFEPGALEPTPRTVLVKLDRTGETVEIGRMVQEVKDALGKPQFSIQGIPLSLGWAITIHKAQGLTVDKAYLDMETITYMKGESKHGLAYVAMSRTRTLEGLLIQNWRDDAVYCSPHVRKLI